MKFKGKQVREGILERGNKCNAVFLKGSDKILTTREGRLR